jgi:hypothetical protein
MYVGLLQGENSDGASLAHESDDGDDDDDADPDEDSDEDDDLAEPVSIVAFDWPQVTRRSAHDNGAAAPRTPPPPSSDGLAGWQTVR